jgi:ribonuclease-3
MKENWLNGLEERLGYRFKNIELITEALTHKSSKQGKNNERLEFLGDAVLDLIVGEYLFKKFPNVDEGDLSKLRASLVNEKGFEKLAKSINLGSYVFLSQAEENNKGREKASILSNAFEALIGEIYLESGLEMAEKISLNLLHEAYPKIDLASVFRNHKTTLQELTQANVGETPQYILVGSSGPDHLKEFEIMVRISDKDIASAKGKSKKDAQQKAAELAIKVLKEKQI